MDGVKFIYFDVGYTLVNEDEVWRARCREQAQTAEARAMGLSADDLFSEIVEASIHYQPQYRAVVEKFGFREVAPYRHELERAYDACGPVLDALSKKYRLGILANQADGLADRLTSWGIRRYFAEIVSSWDCKVKKPDRRLFEIAVERAGCSSMEIVMVGDRLDNDIFPANAVGMRTIWVKQGFGGLQKPLSEAQRPTEEVDSLEELLSIL